MNSYLFGLVSGVALGILIDVVMCTALTRTQDTSPELTDETDDWYDKW